MTFIRNMFADLFPAWSGRVAVGREAKATKARQATFDSFQKALKYGGYTEVSRTIQAPSMDISDGPESDGPESDEPTRDTQDGPSSNPKGAGEPRRASGAAKKV